MSQEAKIIIERIKKGELTEFEIRILKRKTEEEKWM